MWKLIKWFIYVSDVCRWVYWLHLLTTHIVYTLYAHTLYISVYWQHTLDLINWYPWLQITVTGDLLNYCTSLKIKIPHLKIAMRCLMRQFRLADWEWYDCNRIKQLNNATCLTLHDYRKSTIVHIFRLIFEIQICMYRYMFILYIMNFEINEKFELT